MTSVPSADRRRDPDTLLADARQGDKAALGRLLSLVERGGAPALHEAAARIFEMSARGPAARR